MLQGMADHDEAARRRRTDSPEELAGAFAARLAGLAGLQRALAAWALARDTLERNLANERVDAGACHKGCHWCCHLDVQVRFADAAHLARRARQDPALEARVRATARRVAGLDPVARLKAAIPCAFLDAESGACGVYADRPLACRAYRSRDAGWCRDLVGTGMGRDGQASPVVKEALGMRSVIQRALVQVTPPAYQAKGELHALVVRVLDALPSGGRNGRD